jgi:hypothetical protein
VGRQRRTRAEGLASVALVLPSPDSPIASMVGAATSRVKRDRYEGYGGFFGVSRKMAQGP